MHAHNSQLIRPDDHFPSALDSSSIRTPNAFPGNIPPLMRAFKPNFSAALRAAHPSDRARCSILPPPGDHR
jgi:hypothetical protein